MLMEENCCGQDLRLVDGLVHALTVSYAVIEEFVSLDLISRTFLHPLFSHFSHYLLISQLSSFFFFFNFLG